MTLQEFSRDIVPIISMCFGALGLISIVMLWWQMRTTSKWNKLQGQNSFLNRQLDDLEGKLQAALKPHGIDFFRQLDELPYDAWNAIRDDDQAFLLVKTYLNAMEDIAAAVRIGFVDSDFAYALEAARMCRAARVFMPFIRYRRECDRDEEIYIELENVSAAWEEKNSQEVKKRDQLKADIAKQVRSRMGLSKRKV